MFLTLRHHGYGLCLKGWLAVVKTHVWPTAWWLSEPSWRCKRLARGGGSARWLCSLKRPQTHKVGHKNNTWRVLILQLCSVACCLPLKLLAHWLSISFNHSSLSRSSFWGTLFCGSRAKTRSILDTWGAKSRSKTQTNCGVLHRYFLLVSYLNPIKLQFDHWDERLFYDLKGNSMVSRSSGSRHRNVFKEALLQLTCVSLTSLWARSFSAKEVKNSSLSTNAGPTQRTSMSAPVKQQSFILKFTLECAAMLWTTIFTRPLREPILFVPQQNVSNSPSPPASDLITGETT